jgi:hypothetical protein
MTTPAIDVLDYLRTAFAQDQIAAFVTQNPDGTIVISADIGPGSSNLYNNPLIGAEGNPGNAQFPLLPEPDIFPSSTDLPGPGVLLNTAADIGKFWMIAAQDGNGNYISVGAYIWFGTQFRFLPFGPAGPPGPYPVIAPQVTLLPPDQQSVQVVSVNGQPVNGPLFGAGTVTNPYVSMMNLSIPDGPRGPGPTLASMADFEALQPTVGQFVTATGNNVSFQGQLCPQWAPSNTGDLPALPYIVPQSAFFAVAGITLGPVVATLANAISTLVGFIGNLTSGIASVLDGAITTLTGAVSRGNTVSGVHTTLSTVSTHINTLLTALGSSVTASSPISQIGFTLNTFSSTVTTPIQTALDAVANDLGLSGVGHTLSTVAQAILNTLGSVVQQIENVFGGNGIPTICAFTVPANPWPWKPIVFGQIRMFEAGLSLNPLSMGIEVVIGWPGGVQIARGFGNTLSGVVNVVPHTSTPGNPSFAMNPWNSIGLIPAGVPGALFINVINDGIASVYNYNPSDAQVMVIACPTTTQAQLGLSTPAALSPKISLQVASVHSP